MMGIDRKWPKTPNLITWGHLMVIYSICHFCQKKSDPAPNLAKILETDTVQMVLQGRRVQNFINYLVVFSEKIDKM
jgi:hypothetical protein